MQTNNILILADNNFASTKKEIFKLAKIITKNRKYLILVYSLKLNSTQIKPNSNGIVLTKKSYVNNIFLVTHHDADFTSSRGIIRKKLSPKK